MDVSFIRDLDVQTELHIALVYSMVNGKNSINTTPIQPSHAQMCSDLLLERHFKKALECGWCNGKQRRTKRLLQQDSKYGDSDGYTFDDPILILEILSRRFLLRGIYLITGSSKDGDGDTSFQWSQFTTQCSRLMFPSKDIMTTE
ncbi:hypothetical protein Tco_0276523 [Tanacetum coccineum]